MGEYLSFRKLITPTLVQFLFWILVVVAIFSALGSIFSGEFWRGILILIVGPLAIRVYCEIVIVIFQINNTLTEIRDNQLVTAIVPPATIVTPPTP